MRNFQSKARAAASFSTLATLAFVLAAAVKWH